MTLHLDCSEEEWDDLIRVVGEKAEHHRNYVKRAAQNPSETVKSNTTAIKHNGLQLYFADLQMKLIAARD